jgi:hypothetical protein
MPQPPIPPSASGPNPKRTIVARVPPTPDASVGMQLEQSREAARIQHAASAPTLASLPPPHTPTDPAHASTLYY